MGRRITAPPPLRHSESVFTDSLAFTSIPSITEFRPMTGVVEN